ncbi:MAG: hypothetical protein K2X47_07580 [Bdellovibrionales bacterium]|nr:hypothetical protein [Bdellovibrionales bacterium]
MARLLQALLLICGFCAPVLAAFAMENPGATVTDLFPENTQAANHSVIQRPTGKAIGLTDDTKAPTPQAVGNRPAAGIKSNQ